MTSCVAFNKAFIHDEWYRVKAHVDKSLKGQTRAYGSIYTAI